MGKKKSNRKASTPATETVATDKPADDATQVTETPEQVQTPESTEVPETPVETSEDTPVTDVEEETDDEDETPEEDQEAPEEVSEDPKVFWVEGYGNVNAKSQKEAEKKAKKILEDRAK